MFMSFIIYQVVFAAGLALGYMVAKNGVSSLQTDLTWIKNEISKLTTPVATPAPTPVPAPVVDPSTAVA